MMIVLSLQITYVMKTKANDDDKPLTCRLYLAFHFFYCMEWLDCIFRSALTSYMNIKFSESIQSAKKQFNVIFNEKEWIEN